MIDLDRIRKLYSHAGELGLIGRTPGGLSFAVTEDALPWERGKASGTAMVVIGDVTHVQVGYVTTHADSGSLAAASPPVVSWDLA